MMRYTQIHPFRLSRENRLLFEGAETFSPQNPEKMKVEKKTLKSLDSLKSKVAESAAEFARNRLNFPTVEEYHNAVLLKNGQEENLDQHWGRAILNPNDGKPRRLIVMISGNNEPLTQKKDRYQSYRGTMYLFDQMSGMNMKDTDVLQLKVGEAVIPFRENPPPGRQSEAAMAHIQNLIDDALAGKGAFAGRTYDKVNMYGFSYGAGAVDNVLKGLEGRSQAGETVPSVDRTIYVDGIRFGSTGTALDETPAISKSHYHLHQENRSFMMPIAGSFAKQDAKALKENVTITATQSPYEGKTVPGLDHRTLHDARYNRNMFGGILAALTQNGS